MRIKIYKNKSISLIPFWIALIALITGGCTQDISVSLPDYPPKLAVLCILQPDSLPVLILNESKGSFDYSDTSRSSGFVENATVVISGNGQKDTLKFYKETDPFKGITKVFYRGKYKIIAGQTYYLDAIEGSRHAVAETYVPSRLEKDTFELEKAETRWGATYLINMLVTDPSGTEDYYLGKLNFPDSRPGPGPGPGPKFEEPTIYADFFENNGSFSDDKLQNGKQIKLPVTYSNEMDSFAPKLIVDCYFYHTTKATTDYFRTLSTQNENGDNPFSEPVMLYSNITGGLGIFGAASKSKTFKVELK